MSVYDGRLESEDVHFVMDHGFQRRLRESRAEQSKAEPHQSGMLESMLLAQRSVPSVAQSEAARSCYAGFGPIKLASKAYERNPELDVRIARSIFAKTDTVGQACMSISARQPE
jgi:hypothetical protein